MKDIEMVVAPIDILDEELSMIVGGKNEKQKNKCKDGTVRNQAKLVDSINVWSFVTVSFIIYKYNVTLKYLNHENNIQIFNNDFAITAKCSCTN